MFLSVFHHSRPGTTPNHLVKWKYSFNRKTPGVLCRVVCQKFTDVSEALTTPNIMAMRKPSAKELVKYE
jgi:hypothetical protein